MTNDTEQQFATLAHPATDATVVVAPHPDDETLGCGGLLHTLARSGQPVTVLFASDGESSDPAMSATGRHRLAAERIEESGRAVEELAPNARIVRLHLPDSALSQHEQTVVHVLEGLCTSTTLLLAPHHLDLHPDHESVGRAAIAVASRRRCALLAYGIWMWHWPREDAQYTWEHARTYALDHDDRRAKRDAMTHYTSQTSARLNSGPVINQDVMDHHLGTSETYFVSLPQ